MKGGTLFSGIGAPETAAPWIDWRWAAEIDPFASVVHKARFPGTVNLGDVTQVDWSAVEPVDLIVAGPPCQDHSVAGRRAGLGGERGNLSLVYAEILDAVDPLWSLTENVPGWLSLADNAFGAFLGRLVGADAALVPGRGQRWTDAGVVDGPRRTAAWRVLDAQFFGVAQRRRRIFVLAVRGAGNRACADALFPLCESLYGDSAPRREARERTPAPITEGTETSCGVADCDRPSEKRGWCNSHYQRWRASGEAGASPINSPGRGRERFWEKVSRSSDCWVYTGALNDHGYGVFWNDKKLVRAHRFAFEDQVGPIPEGLQLDHICRNRACVRPSHLEAVTSGENTRRGNAGRHWAEKRGDERVAPTLDSRSSAGGAAWGTDFLADGGRAGVGVGAVAFTITPSQSNKDYNAREADRTQAICSNGNRPSARGGDLAVEGGQAPAISAASMTVRRLTPTEAERLQGFADGWTLVEYRGKPAADGNRYRALGNSMAVPCVAWLLRRVRDA